MLDKRCGTLPYVAPEVLTRSYQATPADVWSCGIILITMLAGELPWDHPTLNCPDYMVWKDNNRWTTATPWKKLDTLVLSLLRKILTPNANARPSVGKIQEHKWCRFTFNGEEEDDTGNSEGFIVILVFKRVFMHLPGPFRYCMTLSWFNSVSEVYAVAMMERGDER